MARVAFIVLAAEGSLSVRRRERAGAKTKSRDCRSRPTARLACAVNACGRRPKRISQTPAHRRNLELARNETARGALYLTTAAVCPNKILRSSSVRIAG